MKKTNLLVCILLFALCMFCMTACGNKKNTNGTNGTTTTKAPITTTAPTTTAGTTSAKKESTGAIKGIINDVEQEVEDLTTTKSTNAAGESR